MILALKWAFSAYSATKSAYSVTEEACSGAEHTAIKTDKSFKIWS